jgi:hypothetical protein
VFVIHVDEKVTNIETGKKIKVQKLAVGEFMDVRELGVIKTNGNEISTA